MAHRVRYGVFISTHECCFFLQESNGDLFLLETFDLSQFDSASFWTKPPSIDGLDLKSRTSFFFNNFGAIRATAARARLRREITFDKT